MEEFIDERDGNRYKIVKIGDLTWFAENLKYRGIEHRFPNRDSDNIHKYGLLYTWENAKLACPKDWRLPTLEEFKQLVIVTGAYINPTVLRDSSWTKSSNFSKFSVLPAGYRDTDGHYYGFGSNSDFWSATPKSNGYTYSFEVSYHDAYVYYTYINSAFSVRCVKGA